jgi:hypothetical protein
METAYFPETSLIIHQTLFFILTLVPHNFNYFVQRPINAQLIDRLLYCSCMFRHYCVILRELIDSTLLSYTSISVQLLVIQFKILHIFHAMEILMFKTFEILKLSFLNLKFASPCIIIQFKSINKLDATISQVYYLTTFFVSWISWTSWKLF